MGKAVERARWLPSSRLAPMADAELEIYAITSGGPLRRAERRLRIQRDEPRDLVRRIALAIVIGYVPLLAAGIRWRVVTGEWSIALQELTPHVRALVTLPLLLASEQLLDDRAAGVGRYLFRSGLLGDDCLERHRTVLSRITHLRDSSVVETALFAIALASTLATPAFTRESAPAMTWSIQPAVFLYRFLALRMLWRWGLWCSYLFRLSRLPLELRATHPDRLAGLEPLTMPSMGFAFVAMTGASVTAATWGDRMRFEHVSAAAFSGGAITYTIVALLLAGAPLWVFTGLLVRIRQEGMRAYGALAHRYSDAFERRWLGRTGEEALGDSDFQALNDLGGSFERVEQIRPVLVTRAMVTTVIVAAALPMVPLVVAEVGAATLLARLARTLL